MNRYIQLGSHGLPVDSKIYYNNQLDNEDPDNEDDFIDDNNQLPEVRNSIVEDQFDKFKKREHYLRINTLNIDSNNRNSSETVNSQIVYYQTLGFLISRVSPTKLFIYQPNNSFKTDNYIYWQNLSSRLTNINGIPVTVIEYDPVKKKPIYNITLISNRELLNYFSWTFLKPLVQDKYDSEALFVADTTNTYFYYFTYITNYSVNASDWLYVNSTGGIELYQVLSTLLGYPTTSYYKVIPSRVLTNIYKIKLLDVKIPNIIFNVNNKAYSVDRYQYFLNGTLRILVENNSFSVNNIDYIGDRIKYDFFYKNALLDINNYNQTAYSFFTTASIQRKIYPDIFIGTNIYDLINSILPLITENDKWLEYLNNNIFELAYYFMVQYNLYYKQKLQLETFALNATNRPDNVFYIYTVDLINDYLAQKKNKPIILKPTAILNNKMPEIYLNDYILYVNNETYRLIIKTVNWLDRIYRAKNDINTINSDFIDCYIVIDGVEQTIGRAIVYDVPYLTTISHGINTGIPSNNIYYTLGIYPYISNFAPLNYQSGTIYGLANWSNTTFIPNAIQLYTEVDTLQNIYYFRVSYDASNSDLFRNNFYRFEYLIFRPITDTIVLSTSANTIITPQCYIFGITPTIAGFVPTNYIKVLYSRPNATILSYNQNTVASYINQIGSVYYYIAYTYGQLPFAKMDIIYDLVGATYIPIGTISEQYDVMTFINTSDTISNYIDGMYIYNATQSKSNRLIRYQFSNTYLAVYNSTGLVNYCSQMFYPAETLYDNTGTSLDITVATTYEYVGQAKDIRFSLALDASIYLSEQVNYDVVADKSLIVQTPPVVIPLDNLRILETRTQTKYNVINYTGKSLILDNKMGVKYTTSILSQPTLDKELNLFIFNLSIKDPMAVLPDIYINRNFEGSIDSTVVGTAYSIDYTPMKYAIIFEKSDNFQSQYLQNWGQYIYNKFASKIAPYNYSVYPNRNYVCQNPERTNMTGLQTYELYPRYDIVLDNGYYNDNTFVDEMENKLNAIQYLEYNYYRKDVEYVDETNRQVNDANFEKPRFKTIYNPTTRQIDIKCYKVLNRIFYTAYYNPITPYLYFKIENANIENNVRIFIEVLKDVANNSYTTTVAPLLDREFTTRILPIFSYELRVISPVPSEDFIATIPPNIRKDLDSARALLSKIGLEPYDFRKDYPNLTKNRRNVGQMLKNVYNNSWSYVSAGKTIFNPGVPIPFQEDELVIIINNIYYNFEQYKLGRIVNMKDMVSNSHGNYSVYIQMMGDTKVSHPFWVGDIIYGLDSGAIAMIVPYEWGMLTEYPEIAQIHSGLPSQDIIKMGYKNYLKYLFKYSGRAYLMDYIQRYNLQAYNEYNLMYQGKGQAKFLLSNFNPFLDWPIQEVKNCFRGFEVYFEYPVAFKIIQNDLVLNFLKENRYCLFLGRNREGIYDTPKDILGFDADQIYTLSDYENNTKAIPWNTTFNNATKMDTMSIIRLYLSYGSDNILQNKFYLKVNSTEGYGIGDTVFLNDVSIRPTLQRNAFNIYNTTNHNVKMIITFEMYLSYILFRLVLIKLSVSVPLGPNDYMRLTANNIGQMTQIVNSLYYAPSTSNVLAYTNFIIENYGTILTANNVNYTDPDLTTNLYMSGTTTPLVNRISLEVANIINVIIINRILKWFVQPENLLLWTKGDRQSYIAINETYIDFSSKEVYRFELEVLDSFIFQPNLLVKDSGGKVIGQITKNNLYSNYYPDNNTFYTVYIRLTPGYSMTLTTGAYVYGEDMLVKNRMKTVPVQITGNNNYVYLYDTYLKYRSIFQATSNNQNTVQEALNFSSPDSINSVFYNIFNLNNQAADSFKNGYYVSVARNEVYFNQPDKIKGTYRIMLNMLDNKNVLRMCQELGLISNIDIINETIVNQPVNLLKNISLIKTLMDVCQLIIDLSPINTFLVDLEWTADLEQEIFSNYRYQVRRVDNEFSIVGSRNVYFERYRYDDIYIYGNPTTNPNALVVPYLNTIFQSIYSNDIMKVAKATNTVETTMCDWNTIIIRHSNINIDIQLFNENENTQFCYGILWVDIYSGEDTAYILFLSASATAPNKTGFTVNRNNLVNFILNFNFIYIDQQKSIDVRTVETNEMNQTNIINTFNFVPASLDTDNPIRTYSYNPAQLAGNRVSYSLINQYRIFKVKMQFPMKYDVIRGTPVLVKDYYTTLYKEPTATIKGKNKLYIAQNWMDKSQFNLQPGSVININYSSYNPIYMRYINNNDNIANQLFSFDNSDIIHEETNVVVSYNPVPIIVSGQNFIELTLENPLKYEFKSGLPVVFSYMPMNMQPNTSITPDYTPWENVLYNNNNIICTCLSTQNIIVNGEWYTKIFYQSEHNLDLYGVSPNGIVGINGKSHRKIYISGMKGFVGANVGFQQIERNYLNSNLVSIEEYQSNKYIKPVPDGLYDVEYIAKEDGITILSSNNYDIKIPGTFDTLYNSNTPEQEDEFIDNNQNYRWFYVVEADNKNISGLTGQYLYQYVPSNLATPATPSNTETRMDMLIKVALIEPTTYVPQPNQTFLLNKTIYRVYGKIIINNLISRFLMDTTSDTTIYDSTSASPEFPINCYLTDINKQYNIGIIYYLYNDSANFTFDDSLPKYYYYNVIIKGRYKGYGGSISIDTQNNLVNSISYTVSNVYDSQNTIELDIENNQNIYCSFYRFNSYGEYSSIYDVYKQNYNKNSMYTTQINPIFTGFQQIPYQYDTNRVVNPNEIINYYDIYPSRYGFIADSGILYKSVINKPYSTDILDYIYVCFKDIDSNVLVDQNDPVGDKIIFAKVYVNKNLNNYDMDYTNYEVVYDIRLLPKLEDLTVFFLDKNGYLVNFNNLDNNLMLEIQEYVERVKNINTRNAMVF